MVQRSPSYIKLAKARFRCMVKAGVPPFGMGMKLVDLECELRNRVGREGYEIIPIDWDKSLQSVAIMFDDADLAPFIARWIDENFPLHSIEWKL